MELIVGDAVIENPISWSLVSVVVLQGKNLKFGSDGYSPFIHKQAFSLVTKAIVLWKINHNPTLVFCCNCEMLIIAFHVKKN